MSGEGRIKVESALRGGGRARGPSRSLETRAGEVVFFAKNSDELSDSESENNEAGSKSDPENEGQSSKEECAEAGDDLGEGASVRRPSLRPVVRSR